MDLQVLDLVDPEGLVAEAIEDSGHGVAKVDLVCDKTLERLHEICKKSL